MTKQYGMLIDIKRCMGCDACIVACKQENDLPPKLDAIPGTTGFSFIRVETIGPEGEYPDLSSMSYRPITCMHCADPPCIPACPTEAIQKRDHDGIVLIDDKTCDGCESCIPECPYDVIQIDPENEIARKCTFCVDLIDQGRSPACVDACSGGAMFFGDINDPAGKISQIIQENKEHCYSLKPEMETGPSVTYLNK
jgi:tetrathionate reductase subunit B